MQHKTPYAAHYFQSRSYPQIWENSYLRESICCIGMNSKRRTHNAIVRRLDKIAAALDRIVTALEAMPDTCNIFRIGNVEGDVTNNNGMNAGNNYGNSESQRGNGNEGNSNNDNSIIGNDDEINKQAPDL